VRTKEVEAVRVVIKMNVEGLRGMKTMEEIIGYN